MGLFPMMPWAQWDYARHRGPRYNVMMGRSLLFLFFVAASAALSARVSAQTQLSAAYASARAAALSIEEQRKLNEELFTAVDRNEASKVSDLLARGAQAGAKDNDADDNTPLHTAAANGSVEAVKALFAVKLDIDARNSEGNTPLMYAAFAGSTEIVRILLNNKADVHAANMFGATALSLSRNYEIARMLIERGADFRAVAPNGWTMLHCAALAGDPQTIQLFLDLGLDPNAKAATGETPYDLAKSSLGSGGDDENYRRIMEMLGRAMKKP